MHKKKTYILLLLVIFVLFLYRNFSYNVIQDVNEQHPEINNMELFSLEHAEVLRNFIYKNMVLTTKDYLMDHHQVSLETGILENKNYQKGGWCGAYANMLKKLYDKYGYESFEYNFGSTGTFTHVVVIVKTLYMGNYIYSIQDPYLNMTYKTKNNKPSDFRSILTNEKIDFVLNKKDIIRSKNGIMLLVSDKYTPKKGQLCNKNKLNTLVCNNVVEGRFVHGHINVPKFFLTPINFGSMGFEEDLSPDDRVRKILDKIESIKN